MNGTAKVLSSALASGRFGFEFRNQLLQLISFHQVLLIAEVADQFGLAVFAQHGAEFIAPQQFEGSGAALPAAGAGKHHLLADGEIGRAHV